MDALCGLLLAGVTTRVRLIAGHDTDFMIAIAKLPVMHLPCSWLSITLSGREKGNASSHSCGAVAISGQIKLQFPTMFCTCLLPVCELEQLFNSQQWDGRAVHEWDQTSLCAVRPPAYWTLHFVVVQAGQFRSSTDCKCQLANALRSSRSA